MNRPKLLEEIQKAGTSQRQLAIKMGIRPSTFCYKTKDQWSGFSLAEARELCDLLQITDPNKIVEIFFSA